MTTRAKCEPEGEFRADPEVVARGRALFAARLEAAAREAAREALLAEAGRAEVSEDERWARGARGARG